MEDRPNPINEKIEKQLQKLQDKIEIKLVLEKEEIIKKAKERKKLYIKLGKKREIPNIKLRGLQPDMNSIINPILFCMANLDIITEFILSDEKQEILNKFPDNNNFIRNFNDLMVDIRDNVIISPSFDKMHEYIRTWMNETYQSQDPKFIINSCLSKLDEEIKLAQVDKRNKFSNLIQDYFSFTLITTKTCVNYYQSLNEEEKKVEKKKCIIIDLFLGDSVLSSAVDFEDNFRDLLLPKDANNNFKESCSLCNGKMILSKSVENLKKYLIININIEKESKDLFQLKYSSLKLKGVDNKDNNFELISALCDINTNTGNIEQNELKKINEKNGKNFKIFFKNFINDKWYRKLDSDAEMLQRDDIEEEIRDYKPNILIYKRVK